MNYDQLTQEERDDIVASNMYSRELEHYQHALNIAVYTEAVKSLPAGEWKDRMLKLKEEAEVEQAKIACLHDALTAQLKDPARKTAAFERVTAERLKAKESPAATR